MKSRYLITLAILLLLALAGAVILNYSTPIGLGLTNDSQAYLNGARNLLAGNGYGYTSGMGEIKPITHFPPAYALTIAAASLATGLEPQRAARLLALVLMAFNILLTGLALGWMTRSRLMAVLGGLLVLTAEVFLYVHGFLLSEPLFLLTSNLALLVTAVYFERPRWPLLAAAGLLAGFAYLTRYVGAAVFGAVLAGLLAVLPGWRQKARSVLVFLAFGLPGVIAWTLRNLTLTGNPTNRELIYHPIAPDELVLGMKNFWTWLMPANYTPDRPGIAWAWAAAGVGLLILAGVLIAWLRVKRPVQNLTVRPAAMFLFGLYALGYALLIFLSMTFIDSSTKFEFRILMPAVLAGSLFLLGWAYQGLLRRPVWLRAAALVVFAGFLLWSAQDDRDWIALFRQDGQGFLALNWRISKTVEYINQLPQDKLIYSNRAPVIYLLTDRTAYVLPTPEDGVKEREREGYLAELEKVREDVRNGAVIVLFNDSGLTDDPGGRAWVAELTQGMAVVERTSDGTIYGADD